MRALLLVSFVVALAACSSPVPSPSASGPMPSPAVPTAPPSASASPPASAEPAASLATSGEVRDDRFALTIEIAKERYAPDEKVEVRTTYTFLGPDGRITASGSGSGLVLIALEQLDGPLDPHGAADDMCAPYELVRGVPNVVPYVKSGGWDGTDPNAAWYNAFFKDPELRLPAGTWQLTARLDASLQACSGDWHTLQAAVTFQVTD